MPKTLRTLAALLSLSLALPLASLALAQGTGPIDRDYEAAKAMELASVKVQLATQPGATATAELTEAETLLRRLREARSADERRKLASQLDMALARLHIVADGAVAPGSR